MTECVGAVGSWFSSQSAIQLVLYALLFLVTVSIWAFASGAGEEWGRQRAVERRARQNLGNDR